MKILTYNDYLLNLLKGKECILAYDTAADFLGLTNGGYRPAAQIFVQEEQNIKGTEQTVIPSFSAKEYVEKDGLLCTSVNQTIIDLLEQRGDEQILTESLANYYFEQGESFAGLKIPKHLKNQFNKYSIWAVEYYDE